MAELVGAIYPGCVLLGMSLRFGGDDEYEAGYHALGSSAWSDLAESICPGIEPNMTISLGGKNCTVCVRMP